MIAVAALALGILLSPPPPETVRAAVKAIREDPSYQKTLPVPSRETTSGGSGRGGSEGGMRSGDAEEDGGGTGRTGRSRRRRTAPAGDPRDGRAMPPPTSLELGDLGRAILWVVAGVVVVVLVVLLIRAFLGRERAAEERKKAAAPAASDPARPVPAVAFDDADRLAKEGRYAEAIHVLLLRTLAALAERGTGLADSWTSREVVRDAPLSNDARTALSGLVDAVEVSRFGFVVPDAAAYAECRARFERMAALPARAGAA
jgi:hypothetical protein